MSSESWAGTREAFAQAARWFVSTAAQGRGQWDELALGEWTVRDLIGHTSRALLTVEAYLGHGARAVEVHSPIDYFRLASTGDPAAVAQRGRDAAVALGAEPADAVAGIASRVLASLRCAVEDDPVATPAGSMRVIDYLPTRTFELTVHTCDLAAVLGVPMQVPEAAAVESLTLIGGLAACTGQAGHLLLAATGRTGLPAGFTVL